MKEASTDHDFSQTMKQAWNERAREDARWYINTVKRDQTDAEFAASARPDVEKFVFADPIFIAGDETQQLRLLEIGCGIGRMTQHLAPAFAEVHATDVSGEMIAQGRARLSHVANVHLHETNGCDFAALPSAYFERIFSVYVFQHVPDVEVVRSNIRDAGRTLKAGGLFKFQTCAITAPEYAQMPKDTWTGASFPESEIRRIARDTGLKLVSVLGNGTQYCWTILRKLRDHAPACLTTHTPRIAFASRADNPQLKQIPANGDYAYLSLLVSGLTEAADANNITVEIAEQAALPCYVGALGAEFAAVARDLHDTRLTQINVAIPETAPSGRVGARVKLSDGQASESIIIELLERQPLIPKIYLVSNAVDGGVDVYARGAKATFRVFADGMNATANPDNVRVHVGAHKLTPRSVAFVPANGVHMTVAEMPDAMRAGATEVRIQFGDLISESVKVDILE